MMPLMGATHSTEMGPAALCAFGLRARVWRPTAPEQLEGPPAGASPHVGRADAHCGVGSQSFLGAAQVLGHGGGRGGKSSRRLGQSQVAPDRPPSSLSGMGCGLSSYPQPQFKPSLSHSPMCRALWIGPGWAVKEHNLEGAGAGCGPPAALPSWVSAACTLLQVTSSACPCLVGHGF